VTGGAGPLQGAGATAVSRALPALSDQPDTRNPRGKIHRGRCQPNHRVPRHLYEVEGESPELQRKISGSARTGQPLLGSPDAASSPSRVRPGVFPLSWTALPVRSAVPVLT